MLSQQKQKARIWTESTRLYFYSREKEILKIEKCMLLEENGGGQVVELEKG